MGDIISLLPDFVANQIAAGEVVQRPSSIVKELIENAIDAGATDITLILKDGGRALVQVIDNGAGMSKADAQLCFERHATSKIKTANDLFHIQTKGFRGEALSSIASVAQVELKTKQKDADLGTSIQIEGSTIKQIEECQTHEGTSISAKHIFYNIPARRNFLKTNATELNHILEEFYRIAIPHFSVSFSVFHNEEELYNLPVAQNIKQRINLLFYKNQHDTLVQVKEDTNYVKIHGFIGKPVHAKKSKTEHYFFVNNRYIKHAYFNHAIKSAYTDLVPESSSPCYFVFFTINPEWIDINIHPTKTEVKFQQEQVIYEILKAAIKHSLGQHNLTPSLDFEKETSFDLPYHYKDKPVSMPQIKVNTNYNPFESLPTPSARELSNKAHWETLYNHVDTLGGVADASAPNLFQGQTIASKMDEQVEEKETPIIFQLHETYIVSKVTSGIMLIHQQYAHERILFERFMAYSKDKHVVSQQLLFPETIDVSPAQHALIQELLPTLSTSGFHIEHFGGLSYIIHGIPNHIQVQEIQAYFICFLDSYMHVNMENKEDTYTKIALSLAKNSALKTGKKLALLEMEELIHKLFACQLPNVSPFGQPTLAILGKDDIFKLFNTSTNG